MHDSTALLMKDPVALCGMQESPLQSKKRDWIFQLYHICESVVLSAVSKILIGSVYRCGVVKLKCSNMYFYVFYNLDRG